MTSTEASRSPASTHEEQVRRLRELLEDFDVGMLITMGHDEAREELHARPMAVAEVTPDGRVSFATARHSRKAHEVETDERVAVSFQSSSRYVFLLGSADLHQDRARIDQLWKDSWKTWFPNGKDDPDLCILEVFPSEAEAWDLKGTKGVRYVFEAARALVKGERADDAGTHEHIVVP